MKKSTALPASSPPSFCILGRPDGIGNRFEQIMILEAYCSMENLTCEYVWQNNYQDRSYPISCTGNAVKIVSHASSSLPVKSFDDIRSHQFKRAAVIKAAAGIRPTFDISFPERPVGVHLRATDRIGKSHPKNMRNKSELFQYISEALHAINHAKPKQVFVCSESKKYRQVFVDHLDPSIEILEPSVTPGAPAEFVDLFALSLCREIWMVSRLSTFSITASIIGNIPLKTFVNDEEVFHRYFANFDLQPMRGVERINTNPLSRLANSLANSVGWYLKKVLNSAP